MEKVLSALLAACMTFYIVGALLFGGVTALATGDFTFDAATGTITKYSGTGGNVTIPDTIDGITVRSIGASAFLGCTNVTGVTLPNSVTTIGTYAFYKLSKLTSVFMGTGIANIGGYAFSNCTKLTNTAIPASVTLIDSYAFSNCLSITQVVIPNSVITIGEGAFYNCTKLADLTIGSAVTSIGAQAFSACSSLTAVTVPAKVTSIGLSAFAPCERLTQINVDSANPNYFTQNGILFNKAKTTLIQYPAAKTGAYTVPAGVTTISTYAFWKCAGLTGILLPSSVKSIGISAFSECTGITGIDLPNGLTTISATAFYGCTNLQSIVIPSGVTSIGTDAFSCCKSLADVSIPSTVSTIGDTAFYNCTSLTAVSIPAAVTKIGIYAFANCSKLTGAYFYGNAPSSFGASVFDFCASGFKIYYYSGTINYTAPTWKGYPTAAFQRATTVAIDAQGKTNQIYGVADGIAFTAVTTPEVVNPNTIWWYVNGVKQAQAGVSFNMTAAELGSYEVSVKVSDNADAVVGTQYFKVLKNSLPPVVTANDIDNVIEGLDLNTMEYAVSENGGISYGDYSSLAQPMLGGSKIIKVRMRENNVYTASADVVLMFTANNGDVTGDGMIDIADVIMAGEMATGSISAFTTEQILRANVNSKADYGVDISDVILIAERAVGGNAPFAVDLP